LRRLTIASTITRLYGRVLFQIAAAPAVLCAMAISPGTERPVSAAQRATGRIEGQVRLVMPPTNATPSGVYPSRRVSRPAPKAAEIANVVVFLKDMPRQADLPTATATITQKDEAFVPRVVAITRGSTVDFPNFDPYFHNVFSLSRGATFDLGRYPKGTTKSQRFQNAGLVKVYCHIHSHMTASIMVFDHPYFRMLSADGSFAIDDVPVGTHQVSAWHERIGENLMQVSVEAGRSKKIEFSLPVDHKQ
jgi:plastocyanin